MTETNWGSVDFDSARLFLEEHEEHAAHSLMLDTGRGQTVILPVNLPALGVTFHGAFMAAPLILFCFILALLPAVGFWKGWELGPKFVFLTGGCLALIFGLFKAFCLMGRNRDLFPRRHFVACGAEGLSAHFARWQIPGPAGRSAIAWRKIAVMERGKVFFPPGLLFGKPFARVVRVRSVDGGELIIPFDPGAERIDVICGRIEETIRQRMQ